MSRPTSSADLEPARKFVSAARAARGPISGFRMLTFARNHEVAGACLRALEDRGEIRCTGPVKDCPKEYRGDLVGQMYESFARCPFPVGSRHPLRPHWVRAEPHPEADEDEDDWRREDGGICGFHAVPDDEERVKRLDEYDRRFPLVTS